MAGGNAGGVIAGASVPASWQLDFTVTLTFLAFAVDSIRDRPALLASLAADTIAIAAHALPFRLGLPVAAMVGIATGMAQEVWIRWRSSR